MDGSAKNRHGLVIPAGLQTLYDLCFALARDPFSRYQKTPGAFFLNCAALSKEFGRHPAELREDFENLMHTKITTREGKYTVRTSPVALLATHTIDGEERLLMMISNALHKFLVLDAMMISYPRTHRCVWELLDEAGVESEELRAEHWMLGISKDDVLGYATGWLDDLKSLGLVGRGTCIDGEMIIYEPAIGFDETQPA